MSACLLRRKRRLLGSQQNGHEVNEESKLWEQMDAGLNSPWLDELQTIFKLRLVMKVWT